MFINEYGEDEYVYISKETPFDVKIEKTSKHPHMTRYYIYFKNLNSNNSHIRIGIYKNLEQARKDLQAFMVAFLKSEETTFTFKKEE